MHLQEFHLENEMHKIIKEFKKQIDHLIPSRRQTLIIVKNKKNLPN